MNMPNPSQPPRNHDADPTQPGHADYPGAHAGRADGDAAGAGSSSSAAQVRMSYKFQRLREKLRQAITNGELSGKLPGERALAKRFHVNAKTLSKALTDLAAEGVLDRSIGRGTYVKGSAPAASAPGRWLVLADAPAGAVADPDVAYLIEELRRRNGELHVATSASVADMRPSFLNGFGAVIDLAADTPESFLRDLVVRNLPVVAVNREPKTYSTHAVLVDTALGAARITRELMLAGHRRLAVVEAAGANGLSRAVRQAAVRYDPAAVVETVSPSEIEQGRCVTGLSEMGVTALVCDCIGTAQRTKRGLARQGVDVPETLSVAAVGCLCGDAGQCPCSGYYVACETLADAVLGLLRENPPNRPTTLWLAGEFVDRGTLATVSPADRSQGSAQGSSTFRFGDAVA